MGKLNAAKREKIPKSEFGLPSSRKYPMPDKSHAANAKARATQMVKKGKLSPASKEKIDAKANKVLGEDMKQPKKVVKVMKAKAKMPKVKMAPKLKSVKPKMGKAK